MSFKSKWRQATNWIDEKSKQLTDWAGIDTDNSIVSGERWEKVAKSFGIAADSALKLFGIKTNIGVSDLGNDKASDKTLSSLGMGDLLPVVGGLGALILVWLLFDD